MMQSQKDYMEIILMGIYIIAILNVLILTNQHILQELLQIFGVLIRNLVIAWLLRKENKSQNHLNLIQMKQLIKKQIQKRKKQLVYKLEIIEQKMKKLNKKMKSISKNIIKQLEGQDQLIQKIRNLKNYFLQTIQLEKIDMSEQQIQKQQKQRRNMIFFQVHYEYQQINMEIGLKLSPFYFLVRRYQLHLLMGCANTNTMKQQLSKHPNATVLPIFPRFQWENGHGYCGQTAIQSCLLFLGSYISQDKVRKIAGSEVLVGENAQDAIKKLNLEYQSWDNENSEIPQYKSYLQWIKKHIEQGHPVIITGYDPEGKCQQYDHIFLAVGVNSQNYNHYNDNDVLIYADFFSQQYTKTAFDKIADDRKMQGNGKQLDFAIPKNVCFGIAILGIKDKEEQFLPVSINLEENSEPNVSVGQESKTFTYTVTINQLTIGKKYACLRYNDYKNIPVDHVYANKASKVYEFTAKATNHEFDDSVESSEMAFYRCVQEEDLE